ncbi:MAG TPA: hypothetical protein VFJ71_11785 [Candidatus Limnocylindrales bacterium]|nr:hypothetical protein [Candidatus Limnocylindrales bacterium]
MTVPSRLARVVAALVVAAAVLVVPARAPVAAAAGDGLQLSTAATYQVSPSARVVHVTIDVTAKNTKPNRVSGGIVTRYFYDGARLAIHPEARNVAAREGSNRLATATKDSEGYDLLDVRFHSSVFFGETAHVRVTYDLPSGAPRSSSAIRVGTAFVTFTAWAFGDRASVRVTLPSSFDAETTGSTATKTTSGGSTVFRATNITDVGSWYLVVTADRKNALTNDRIDLVGGEHLVIRAWPEDDEWSARVRDLLTRGLPELAEQTGLDWPVDGDINVFEVHTPLLEGYAGQFFVGENRIEISEDLDDLTIIHEASHAWFNNALFLSRWINEGLADMYAAETLRQIGQGDLQPDRISPTDPGAVRLDAWIHPGRITDDATEQQERYGYEASWTVIRSIFVEVGSVQMRHVLSAAEHHQIAYQGVGEPEVIETTNDWHRLLDLVDEIGRSKGADELFRRWVLSPDNAATLDARGAARTAYAGLVSAGGQWRPPFYVREPMSSWQFDVATNRITEATALLAKRDELAKVAGSLGLTPPTALRDAYQTAKDSLDPAKAIATSELAAANALTVATAAVAAPRAPFVTIGLIGETPEASLAAARDAFTSGASDAEARALAVTALIDGAVAVGRGRATAVTAGIGVATLLLIVALLLLYRRRRRRLALAGSGAVWGPRLDELADVAAPLDPGSAEAAGYVTLADPAAEGLEASEPPEPTALVDPVATPDDHGDAPLTQEA